MQRVDRNVVFPGEAQHRFARPIEQRVELENAAVPIDIGQPDVAARLRLTRPDACDPSRSLGERAVERLDLKTKRMRMP
jgi:hypothetical protein